jgi:hypothetical protein
MIDNLMIFDATVTGNGTASSSGIGTGPGNWSKINNLALLGGRITAKGDFAGIGNPELLTIGGNIEIAADANPGSVPIIAFSILFQNADVLFRTTQDRLLGSFPDVGGSLTLAIVYGDVTAEGNEPLLGLGLNESFLQIGNLSIPDGFPWTFHFSSGDQIERSLALNLSGAKSILFSLPRKGTYSISASVNGTTDVIETDDYRLAIDVDSDVVYVAGAHWGLGATPMPSKTPIATATPPPTWTPTEQFTVSLQSGYHRKNLFVLRGSFYAFWDLDFDF